MTENQTIWMTLWHRAASGPEPGQPFEVAEVVPEIAKALGVSTEAAGKKVAMLLEELGRLPDDRQFFNEQGHAVVPRPEFADQRGRDDASALATYPFEL